MIELKQLTKTFHTIQGDITALQDINLTIEDGEIFGIIGLSGAGKSTLVRCMNLLERPTFGEVLIDGKNLMTMPKKELLATRQSIGMIFQGFNLLEQRTLIRNVCYPLEIAGVKKADARKRAAELLELVGLGARHESYPSQLSGGQKQRVAIARALATSPKYLLCDEATSALDPNTTQQILSLLKEINQKLGVTIIVITHEMSVIDRICDRVAVIDNSHIVEVGRVSEVFTAPQSDIAKDLILPKALSAQVGARMVRIVFDGQSSFRPIISNLVLECQAPVNIMFADTRDIDGTAYGQMVIALPEDPKMVDKIYAWLKANRVTYREETGGAVQKRIET